MSYDASDAKAEFRGMVQAGRKARAKARSLKRAKSPSFKAAKEQAKKLTREASNLYGYSQEHQ